MTENNNRDHSKRSPSPPLSSLTRSDTVTASSLTYTSTEASTSSSTNPPLSHTLTASSTPTPHPTPTPTLTSSVTMLATQLPSALGGHMYSGPLPSKTPATIQMELQQLKTAPILNPHFRMVQRYIDCLNWYIDVCVSSQGPAGVRAWILEVQWFTKAVQRRTYQSMPLTPEERSAIMQFTTYWRQQAHAPYMMSRPEVQVVLIALAETAYM